MVQISTNNRIDLIDALRGFAILAIMLLHNMEHFDFIYKPQNLPESIMALDEIVFDIARILFSGKAYAIFALLFGFTFFIQTDRQQKLGKDFSGRFAWRMFLLLCFGLINSAFYQGDILMIYALVGFFLIPIPKLKDKTVLWIAVICLLQPFALVNITKIILDPDIVYAKISYFKDTEEYLANGSFFDVLWGNLTIGKKAVWWWSWDKGRFFQTYALFLFGYLAGRKNIFTQTNLKLWTRVLLLSVVFYCLLYFLEQELRECITRKTLIRPLSELIRTWYNFAFTLIWVSGFSLLYTLNGFKRNIQFLSFLGKMSLTNYIMQSVIGSFIYYGYGLGLYFYMGASYSLLIGIILLTLQVLFCKWWLKNHRRGPLEDLWHRMTWMKRSGLSA